MPISIPWQPPEGPTYVVSPFVLQSNNLRLVQREVRLENSGMLIEFAITVSQIVEGKHVELLCIDSCNHGNVHRHLNNHKEFSVIKELLFEGDLDAGFDLAIDEATNFYLEKLGGAS